MIVSMNKRSRLLILVSFCMVGAVLGAITLLASYDFPSAADRRNAMQVVKPMAQDPVPLSTAPDFFTEYRLEREKIRSERSDLLREVMKHARTDDMRVKAQETVLKIAIDKQRESELENIIKSKGFADVIVFIRDRSVSPVVKTTVLTKEEVLQVADIITRTAGVKAEEISISAKP